MRIYIEIAWAFSTVFGIFLFLIELAIICWLKFWSIKYNNFKSGQLAALVASLILIPVAIIFISFAIHFYRTLITHKFERSEKNLKELEECGRLMSQLAHDHPLAMQTQPFLSNTRSLVVETV